MPAEEHVGCRGRCALVAQVWGVGFWIYIFLDCIAMEFKRALAPFQQNDLGSWQWVGFAAISLSLLLVEGVQAFQRSFSPMLICRARELTSQRACWEFLLAPFFVAGLISANKKRLVKSWLLMAILVPGLAISVPRMPYPWRQAVDAGVVLGLGWGTAALIVFWLRGWFYGKWPQVSADLPAETITSAQWPEAHAKPNAQSTNIPLATA
mmetsp:Transcript_16549/g.28942  ORF Transcript_16549/g.28942 Transcript_16549/m.28942 type:complete len:209 (+) Transcript_16549:46-672(+)